MEFAAMQRDESRAPRVTGHRPLADEEVAHMNEIGDHGAKLGHLVQKLRDMGEKADQRWVSIGATSLQNGIMQLRRAVAKPTNF